ncbi:MAG: hypothetical protein Q9196_006325, partial [Gyalolechia fulgens]
MRQENRCPHSRARIVRLEPQGRRIEIRKRAQPGVLDLRAKWHPPAQAYKPAKGAAAAEQRMYCGGAALADAHQDHLRRPLGDHTHLILDHTADVMDRGPRREDLRPAALP